MYVFAFPGLIDKSSQFEVLASSLAATIEGVV